MRRLTSLEVHSRIVAQLGLDPKIVGLSSVEAIAAGLRRASHFLCPCAPATLVRVIVEPMRELVEDIDVFRASVQETLEAMIGHGRLP